LAVSHAYVGDRGAARDMVTGAKALAEETRRPADLQFAFLADGVVTELEGRLADSIPLFETALDIVRTAEMPYFEDWILVELGEALLALGRVEPALALLEPSYRDRAGTVAEQFHALIGAALGKAQTLAGRFETAEATLGQVLAYARRVAHRQLEQMALRRLSMAVAARDPVLAQSLIEDGIAVAEANELPLGLAKCLEAKAALLGQGAPKEAAAAWQRASRIRTALHSPLPSHAVQAWSGEIAGE